MTTTLEPDTDRTTFAAEFDAVLDTIEWIRVPAPVLPERDFSDFTL